MHGVKVKIIKKSDYLKLTEFYNSSKATYSGSLSDKFCLLQKLINQPLEGTFFPLLNLLSVPFLSAY